MPDAITTEDFRAWLRAFATAIERDRDRLTELDAAIGDADHGSNMARGLAAVVAVLDGPGLDTAPALFTKAGMTLVSTVGGASGPLYGTFFLRLGRALGDDELVEPRQVAAAWRAGLEGVLARGKAEPGDKTMLDALVPAVDALDAALDAGTGWAQALRADEELVRLWDAPVRTPGLRWGA